MIPNSLGVMSKTLRIICITTLLTGLLLLLSNCTKSETSSDNSGSSSGTSNSGGGNTTGNISERSNCGVLVGGSVQNPPNISSGVRVEIAQVLEANTLGVILINSDGSRSNPVLFKIFGIGGAASGKQDIARRVTSDFLRGGAILVRPQGSSCNAPVSQGAIAEVGQFLNARGTSLGEELLSRGLVVPETVPACGEESLLGCYSAIQGTNPDVAGQLTSFLWKPISESDSKLAIHTGPFGTSVFVNGEKGVNRGPGNGFGSLARFSRPGCGYPNPRVQVIDDRTGLPYTVDGNTSFSIPNPCGRFCLVAGRIAGC